MSDSLSQARFRKFFAYVFYVWGALGIVSRAFVFISGGEIQFQNPEQEGAFIAPVILIIIGWCVDQSARNKYMQAESEDNNK